MWKEEKNGGNADIVVQSPELYYRRSPPSPAQSTTHSTMSSLGSAAAGMWSTCTVCCGPQWCSTWLACSWASSTPPSSERTRTWWAEVQTIVTQKKRENWSCFLLYRQLSKKQLKKSQWTTLKRQVWLLRKKKDLILLAWHILHPAEGFLLYSGVPCIK